jgi:hypothetical protein
VSRAFDRGPQLGGAHRAEHDLPVLQGRQKLRIGCAAAVQISPHPKDHQRGRLTTPRAVTGARRRAQRADEDLAVLILGAPQEGLLELVHHQDHPRPADLPATSPGR